MEKVYLTKRKLIHFNFASDVVWSECFLELDHSAPTRKTLRKLFRESPEN